MRASLIRAGIVLLSLGVVACGSTETATVERDGSVCPSPLCGKVCCADGQVCRDGACQECVQETEAEFCGRIGKTCGQQSAPDNCGKPRTVASCGECEPRFVCDSAKGECVDTCVSESNDDLCARLKRHCGEYRGKDNCDKDRAVNCGTCGADQHCEETTSTCVDNCEKETDRVFCSRLKRECGRYSGSDNCNKPRTADCGSCTGNHQQCDQNTNTCYEVCWDETAFCLNSNARCGSKTGLDNCNTVRTVDCGGCPAGEICIALNQCTGCMPEDDTAFCARQSGNCSSVSGQDNCGATRTVSCPCVLPDNCGTAQLIDLSGGSATISGDTTNAQADSMSLRKNVGLGRDLVYWFTVSTPVNFSATQTFASTSNWAVPYLRKVCDATNVADELLAADPGRNIATISMNPLPAGTYWLWVDAYMNDYGPFTLAVTATP